MKAMVLRKIDRIENSPLKLEDVPHPKISEDEILVKVSACGICHTDLHIIEGEIPARKIPLIPGHQITGYVKETGEKVKNFKKGERVGIPWLNFTCGICEYCKKDRENLCENALFTGYDVDGGYAEYVKIKEEFAYKIPSSFYDLLYVAPLLCAGAIGYRALKLSNIKEGENLGIFGFGASAHIVLQMANYMKCNVYVFTRSPQHQELAEKLGAVWIGTAKENPNELLDACIVFAPAGELVIEALKKTKRGGTVIHAGIYSTPIPEIYYNLIYFERSIKTVANLKREDVKEFLEVSSKISLKIEVQIFKLEEANTALSLLKGSKINGVGVLQVD